MRLSKQRCECASDADAAVVVVVDAAFLQVLDVIGRDVRRSELAALDQGLGAWCVAGQLKA